jgi:Tol biopolymer transport system component
MSRSRRPTGRSPIPKSVATLAPPYQSQTRHAPCPIEDIGVRRAALGSTAWSVDGKQIFVATNLTGRTNIWRTDTAGSWPVQLTQSDDSQSGLAASADGKYLYFQQDVGGNEYTDIYRVPVERRRGREPDQHPRSCARATCWSARAAGWSRCRPSSSPKGQSNVAVMDADGKVRVLTKEADPQYGWSPVAWIDGGKALIANRDRVDSKVAEVWRIDVATGAATKADRQGRHRL